MLINTRHIEAISIDDPHWDDIVYRFANYDIYYLSGYVKAFQLNGDGQPYLVHYDCGGVEGIYVMMLRPTSNPEWFDATTPYGYGGFLFNGNPSKEALSGMSDEWKLFADENGLVSNFVRFHPLLGNAAQSRGFMEVVDLNNTIYIDLTSAEVVWQNITSKNRNMIRKAEKNGVEIGHGHGMDLLGTFMDIYNRTMNHDNAEAYYYFPREFYQSINNDLAGNNEIFFATHDGLIISMAIIIFANSKMHYHLSGSLFEYRNLAPSNLLLYKAALWGIDHGMATFHLGGGVGSGQDGLYKFKEAFNRVGQLRFSIGKEIFNEERYNSLVKIRKDADPAFSDRSSFFPLYRS